MPIRPQMADYPGRLQMRLAEKGAACPVYMIRPGGGLISVETAAEFPVRLVELGPAGGAIFAADVARRFSGWRRWSAMTWAAPRPRSV